MKAPSRVLLSCVVVIVALLAVIFYRYDLLPGIRPQLQNQQTDTTPAMPADPRPSENQTSASAAPSPSQPVAAPAAQASSENQASLQNGKKLYEEKTCVLCHGATGKADTPTGLAMKATDLTSGKFQANTQNIEATAYILKVLNEGVPGTAMVSFKAQIPAEKDRKDLALYVHSLSAKK